MYRGMFLAAACAAFTNVGALGATQDEPGQPAVPESVALYLSDSHSAKALGSHEFSDTPLPLSESLTADLPVFLPPSVVAVPQEREEHIERALVPLPSPLWSGGAGLLGLGIIRLLRSLRRRA